MPRLNIEFDLDGVLINYLECLKWYLRNRGIAHIPSGNWYFETCPDVSLGTLYKYINEAMRHVDRIKPMPGARDVIKFLWDLTHDPIKITTARPMENIDVTRQSIETVLGNIPYFFAMVESGKDKANYIRSRCYIDDRRKNCIALANKGYTVFMPEREYNMPVEPQEGFSVCEKGMYNVKHTGTWSRNDGQIIIIEEIKDLLHPDWMRLIIS